MIIPENLFLWLTAAPARQLCFTPVFGGWRASLMTDDCLACQYGDGPSPQAALDDLFKIVTEYPLM